MTGNQEIHVRLRRSEVGGIAGDAQHPVSEGVQASWPHGDADRPDAAITASNRSPSTDQPGFTSLTGAARRMRSVTPNASA